MEEPGKYEATEKQSIDTSLSTRGGLVPSNLEQMWRLALIMAKSGLMPKGLQSPEAVCVAVQMGLEVGLTPMQAVQNIAVINGRPAIWGDSGIALVEASGFLEDFKETITVEGEVITATCWAKRKNRPTPVERTFTTQDAKQAGLHKKEGPWQQYPKRMTQMRARWWVLRDLFADVLKGLKAAEEVQDIIDVTPEPARTLKVEGGEKSGGPIYDIKGEPDRIPQSPPESAAMAAPGSGEGEKAPSQDPKQPEIPINVPEAKPSKAKTLFENLMVARGTFCHMVLDNKGAIQNFLPDELRAVKERWAKAAAQGIGGITKGDPWPIQDKKEEKPLFEVEEGEKKEEKQADPFLATVEQYRKEIDDEKVWDQVLRISGITHTGISSIPEGEPRISFLARCSRTLDQRNAAKKNKVS